MSIDDSFSTEAYDAICVNDDTCNNDKLIKQIKERSRYAKIYVISAPLNLLSVLSQNAIKWTDITIP